ncbi:MAG: PAS domain S-box protein, partial [Planctomycetes bacterium]|nr:PAS domain S-box protein [Planctomycetota bacterium]
MKPLESASISTWSGVRIALALLLMIFVTEIGVHCILAVVLPDQVSPWTEALVDAGLVSLAITPAMYWIIVVPLRLTLAETQTKSEAILSSAADGIITINPDGIVESFNRAAEKMFDYTSDEIVGRNVSVLMPAPHADEHDDHLDRYARTGEQHVIALRREVVGQRRDGTTFPMDLHISEIRHAHGRMFAGITTDITQRKCAEREMA